MLIAEQLHLVVDRHVSADAPIDRRSPVTPSEVASTSQAPTSTLLPTIPIPLGVSFVELVRHDVRPQLSRTRPARGEFLVLEPVEMGGRPKLAVFNPLGFTIRLNGGLAPPVAVLNEKDQLQANSHIFHVTHFHNPRIDAAGEEVLGKPCPVCQTPIAGGRVFRCGACEAPFHIASDDEPENERLNCARMVSQCSSCGSAMSFEPRFSYVPELFDDHAV